MGLEILYWSANCPKTWRIFIDSDHEIERRAAMQVPIFAQHGEAYFRKQEYYTIADCYIVRIFNQRWRCFIAPKTHCDAIKGINHLANADFSTSGTGLLARKIARCLMALTANDAKTA